MSHYLFVYGTLRSRFRNPAARALRARAALVGVGSVSGRLYRLTRYPGLLPAHSPQDIVTGEVYRLRANPAFWKRMDVYEGTEYQRVSQSVLLEDGRTLTAWVYRYRHSVCGRRRIRSGDFLSVPNSVAFGPRWASRRTK